MKNIYANAPTFTVEVVFTACDPNNPQDKERISRQRQEEADWAYAHYCETRAIYSQTGSPLGMIPLDSLIPDKYVKCVAKITEGPERMGQKQFHYPLVVKTVNLLDDELWTANRPLYSADGQGLGEAQSKIVFDIRNQLSTYDIQQGYKIRMNSHYGDENVTYDFGPFSSPFNQYDTDTDPEFLKDALFCGLDGSVTDIVNYILDHNTPPTQKEIARKGLTDFCIFASDRRNLTNEHSPELMKALKIQSAQVLTDPKGLQALLKIPTTHKL